MRVRPTNSVLHYLYLVTCRPLCGIEIDQTEINWPGPVVFYQFSEDDVWYKIGKSWYKNCGLTIIAFNFDVILCVSLNDVYCV